MGNKVERNLRNCDVDPMDWEQAQEIGAASKPYPVNRLDVIKRAINVGLPLVMQELMERSVNRD